MDHAGKGFKALATSDAATAVVEYTKALIEHPTSPDYYTQRAKAFTQIRPARHDLALEDAEYAVLCGQKRGKRDKIQAGQQRRVVALYNLERYADAKFVLDGMKKWRPKDSKPQEMEHNIWEAKINKKLEGNLKESTVAEYPSTPLPEEKAIKKGLQKQLKADGTFNYDGEEVEVAETPKEEATPSSTAMPATADQPATTTKPPPQKIRHEWYQNNQSIIVTVYAKGVQKDKTEVNIEEDLVTLSFPHPSDPSTSFDFSLDPLFALIDPTKSKSQIMSTKIELTLAKALQGQKWSTIEGSAPLKTSNGDQNDKDPARVAMMSSIQQPASTTTTAPSYPTSSKSGPKNWDKVASDLTAKRPKKKSAADKKKDDAKKDSDASQSDDADDGYDSDYGGDQVDGFFKKLYAGADPDTRKAMMKSFQESNGTALSTNWSEVGSKKVEEVKGKGD